jgi:hypothetical protein
MEYTLLDTENAKAKPSPHSKFTVKASENEIGGDASVTEALDAAVVSSLTFFRRSMLFQLNCEKKNKP